MKFSILYPRLELISTKFLQQKIDFFNTPGTDAANSLEISTVTKKNCMYYKTSLIDHRVSHLNLQETHLLGLNLYY